MTNNLQSPMNTPETTVDVRALAPMYCHQRIFETFEALQSGENFLLINDHDPKPLYYQFQAERAGQFTWNYVEQGPEVWSVVIGKTR